MRAKRAYNGAKTRRTRRAPPIHWQRLGPAGALNRDDEARVRGAERERDSENDCLPQRAVFPKQWRRCHDSGSALCITRAGGRLAPCRRHGGIMRKTADQRGQEDSGPGTCTHVRRRTPAARMTTCTHVRTQTHTCLADEQGTYVRTYIRTYLVFGGLALGICTYVQLSCEATNTVYVRM